MGLLSIESVSKRRSEAGREHTVLREVTMQVEAGELVGVWGARRSGRTTLLRIAAGVDQPDEGRVLFAGLDLAKHASRTLGTGIGYVARSLRGSEEQRVLEQVATTLLARGVQVEESRERAREALRRVGAQDCAAMRVGELSAGELTRVAIARALALSPGLLVIDEPTATVDLAERDGILMLLRELALGQTAVLASSGAPEELAGFHRVLSLGEGNLRGAPSKDLAPVVALHSRAV